MQKKIIALAVAAAFSTPAFADVGFYGIVDAAVASISASGLKGDLVAASGAASTSRLGVKATEDIGSGLTAVAVVEYGIDTQDTGSTLTARQKMLAVAGSFGTVATGYLQTTGYDWQVKFDPIAGSGSSPLQIVNQKAFLIGTVAGAARAQRALAYISPNISGLTLAANYSTALGGLGNVATASTSAAEKSTAYLLSATYTLDALTVGAVYAGLTGATTVAPTVKAADQTEFALGASYDLGVAKVMGTYQSNKATGVSANTAYSLSGVLPVSTGAFAVLYGANKLATSAVSATAITAGYLHTFTKSTTGYVVVSSVKNGSGTSVYSVSGNALSTLVTAGGSSTLFGVGLRKKF
jgi:predicted porin